MGLVNDSLVNHTLVPRGDAYRLELQSISATSKKRGLVHETT